ncbi:lactate dehydrogenase-like oxidoreductase [Novosphingobium sp. AP12]|nr:lactate dehydrogenase-like oxidoreductase [Novosphingobium sp. AP12]
MSASSLRQALTDYDVICPTVTDRITRAMIEQQGLRTALLCNYGAGLDHIDLDACREAGITVTNTPDVLTDATAEVALTLMLMVARRAGEGERELRGGDWTGWRPTHLLGRQLSGSVLGLIGFGRIAQRTAQLGRAFGMDVIYHSRSRAAPAVEAEHRAQYRPELESLLRESDFVSLHCPGGAATDNLIDTARLEQMRRTAFLINTARGSVIDEDALVTALESGAIAGAGLDVFRNEPAISPALMDAPNLVMLPHLGSATEESRTAMGMRALDNLDHWLRGEAPPDRVAHP